MHLYLLSIWFVISHFSSTHSLYWELGFAILRWELGFAILCWELGFAILLWQNIKVDRPAKMKMKHVNVVEIENQYV